MSCQITKGHDQAHPISPSHTSSNTATESRMGDTAFVTAISLAQAVPRF
ncbi:uncharacterized protein RCO7_14927 [Rhynchosporium graminicola]|uniref:Uncharacterized protein n=2 Tax=Rhynchosporium TaxID=38037 RepID=A0A1E1MRI7_RHYSE|nr:uncharacterized protein RCO7_14927 [Rhynchosporium commune]CZT51680.1 uncharacterized protein RSE6_12859 [Rhynchosporium secalis]